MINIFRKRITWIFITLVFISGCTGSNILTEQEVENQNKADAVVAGTLFDHELDTQASYNIRKDGFVVIKFDESVPENKYTDVVNLLRSNADINGLRAEQNDIEVCPVLH